VPEEQNDEGTPASPFADLDEMQQEIAKRIRDNKRFLEKFLDEDFLDGEDEGVEEEDTVFEEL
jgi:hypothetical protein